MARKVLIQIEVENVGAARRLEALREEIRRLNKELKGAEVGTPVFNDLIARITDAKQEAAKLKEEQKALNREFKAAQVPKDSLAGLRIEYAKLTEQIKVLSAVERQSAFGQSLIKNAAGVKKEIDGIEQSIGRFTGNVGNYRSAFQGIQNALLTIGAGFGVNEIIQQNARLSDSIANVAKTTGLTIEQAEKLADALELRDTRTSLADQLQIAEIGGQLGIATEQIENFTAGVDVLNVALGDQFGNVETLTREFAGLRNVLTDFKTEDAADDILKLGNAVNFLEARGNATGQTIVEFASRIAGAGVPLGATTEQIIGLSTTLAELSINPERGATAVSRLLTEVARAPEAFARAIGEPADQFRKLVQTDIVGALALISERISTSSETNIAFAQTLETLGIGAQGAIEVFGKLGGSTDLLRQRIAQAGETLQNTDSITREFEVKNTNAAAAVEKLRNAIIGALTSSEAQDAIAGIANALTGLIEVLGDTFEFLDENRAIAIEFAAALIYLNRQGILQAIPLLKTLGVSLGVLVVNEQGAVIATNTLTTAQGRAAIAAGVQTTATRALALAQAALPFAVIIAGTYALVTAWYAYQDSASAAEKATRAVADAQEEIAESSAKEINALRGNIAVLKSDISSKEERKRAIEELNRIYPEYLKGIDLEKAGVSELTTIQDDLTASILRSAAARAKTAAQEEVTTKIIEKQLRIDTVLRNAREISVTESLKFGGGTGFDLEEQQRRVVAGLRKELQSLKDEFEETGKAFDRAFQLDDPEFDLSPAKQDALDLQRQFAENAKTTKQLGEESTAAGDKIKGLGDKSKGAKSDIEAQEGSIAALRAEISKLEKQIEATAPEPQLLTPLVKRLNEAQGELEKASLLLEELKNRAAGGIEIEAELAPLPTLAVPSSVEVQSEAERIKAIQKDISDNATKLLKKQEEERAEAAAKEKARQEELADLARESAFQAAETISNSVFEIQRNRLEQQTQLQIDQLDIETQARIAAAKGNETKIAAIEKDAQKKREAIEKAAAEKRKQIAITEAIINTALAVTKALTGAPPPANLILAGVALAAGVAQQAVIRSQEFAEGGVAGAADEVLRKTGAAAPKRLSSGIIKERPNAPRTEKGDSVLAYLAPGEMVLNRKQQGSIREMFGQDAFALAGVPGEAATRRGGLPGFASGGIVGIVPQNGFAQQTTTQAITVQAKAEFTPEQVAALGGTLGAIIGELVERGAFNGTLLGNDEANRMAERQAAMTQNREG